MLGTLPFKLLELNQRIGELFMRRQQEAWRDYAAAIDKAATVPPMLWPWRLPQAAAAYARDFAERSVIMADILRQRGDNFLDHELAGKPPLLKFAHEIVLDAQHFERPANYRLLRILPPEGQEPAPDTRPYLIIDPRAGHGAGIGGFKQDSEVGMLLRNRHPVYFVVFEPKPVPGQTLWDVCLAEAEFLREIARRHPEGEKPAIIGNCQGGWAAMLLAATHPDLAGPLVINGAPLSYWSGNDGENPMRYAGGLLGGSWSAHMASDLGDGLFDGAYLVQNFESLNPGNTHFDKYYQVFKNPEAEAERFLDFERWWGGFHHMSAEEIRWILDHLFIGNDLTEGSIAKAGHAINLQAIRSPIVVFASMGDNITPPQQAFNWITDVYGSTEALKAAGQVIVGLVHENVGHLGIFASSKVATKEHDQIIGLIDRISTLPPGLYAMDIVEETGPNGEIRYQATLTERRLEELCHLNHFERHDEIPFASVELVSELNERIYRLTLQPWLRATSNPTSAALLRALHPLRLERWSVSSLNPALRGLGPLRELVETNRRPVGMDNPFRFMEDQFAKGISAAFDLYRDLRDGQLERLFFMTYAPLALIGARNEHAIIDRAHTEAHLPSVELLRPHLLEGGYREAVARTWLMLGQALPVLPLPGLGEAQNYLRKDPAFAALDDDELRSVFLGQSALVWRLPEEALNTLPQLVAGPGELERLVNFIDVLVRDYGRSRNLRERWLGLRPILAPELPVPDLTPAELKFPAEEKSVSAAAKKAVAKKTGTRKSPRKSATSKDGDTPQ